MRKIIWFLAIVLAATLMTYLLALVVFMFNFGAPRLPQVATRVLAAFGVVLGPKYGGIAVEDVWKFVCDLSPSCYYEGPEGGTIFHVQIQ